MNDKYVDVQVALTALVLSAGEEGVAGMQSELLAKFLSYADLI